MEKKGSMICSSLRRAYKRNCVIASLFAMLALTFATPAYANETDVYQAEGKRTITGVVTENGAPLPGVAVMVKGTTNGVVVGSDGKYSIEVDRNAKVVLMFQALGMKTVERVVGASNVINVAMEEDVISLGETVVVGYQSVHKRNVTSSVASVKAEELTDIPVASITEMLSGQVAGLQVQSTGGGPGSKQAIVIRGSTVVSGSLGEANEFSDPLYVIDGIPTTLQDLAGYDMTNSDYLASLNPEDIESIDILKDASAAAIYGSRGANGVIIIKTKGGIIGDLQVSVKAAVGVNVRPELKKTYIGNTERHAKLNLIANSGWSYANLRDNLPLLLTDSLNPSYNNAIDYQGLFYQTGMNQDYSLSLSGGTEDLNYRMSLGFYNEKGIVKANGYQRYSFSLNVSQKLFKVLKNQTVIRFSYTDRQTGMGNANSNNTFPVKLSDMQSSLLEVTPEELDFINGKLNDLYNTARTLNASFSNYANLDIYKGITLNSQIGVSYDHTKKNYFQPSTVRTDGMGYADYYWGYTARASVETYLSYTKDFNEKHSINLLLGNSFDFTQIESVNVWGQGGSGDMVHTVAGYRKEDIGGGSTVEMNSMVSFWARAGYRFLDRYMVDFNYRRDASSRFGKNNRWADFPSMSVAWIFSDEPWLASQKEWLSFAKVKFSYGINGKQFSDNYLRYNMYNLGYDGVGNSHGKMIVSSYDGVISSIPKFGQLADNYLSWEQSEQWDLGIEFEFFKRRLFATLDFYNRKTDDLLFDVAFPGYTGFTNVKSNVAGIQNSGFELSLDGYIFKRSSQHQIQIQTGISHNSNVITKLPNNNRDYYGSGYGYTVGMAGPVYYGLHYLHPIDDPDLLPVNPFTGKPLDPTKNGVWGKVEPGYPLFEDITADYVVTDEDQYLMHYNPNPDIQGYFNPSFSYKGWKLKVNTEFIFGRDVYDDVSMNILNRYDWGSWLDKAVIDLSEYDIWQKPGDVDAKYPSLLAYVPGSAGRYAFRGTSMWWEKGDYWKIKDITLSYNFDSNLMKKIGFDRIYVYGTVYNVWQWQASKTVIDASMVDSRGHTYGDGYPTARKFVLGVNFQF